MTELVGVEDRVEPRHAAAGDVEAEDVDQPPVGVA
jgi:hypothetical protein